MRLDPVPIVHAASPTRLAAAFDILPTDLDTACDAYDTGLTTLTRLATAHTAAPTATDIPPTRLVAVHTAPAAHLVPAAPAARFTTLTAASTMRGALTTLVAAPTVRDMLTTITRFAAAHTAAPTMLDIPPTRLTTAHTAHDARVAHPTRHVAALTACRVGALREAVSAAGCDGALREAVSAAGCDGALREAVPTAGCGGMLLHTGGVPFAGMLLAAGMLFGVRFHYKTLRILLTV
eukprot:gene13062-19454_t